MANGGASQDPRLIPYSTEELRKTIPPPRPRRSLAVSQSWNYGAIYEMVILSRGAWHYGAIQRAFVVSATGGLATINRKEHCPMRKEGGSCDGWQVAAVT